MENWGCLLEFFRGSPLERMGWIYINLPRLIIGYINHTYIKLDTLKFKKSKGTTILHRATVKLQFKRSFIYWHACIFFFPSEIYFNIVKLFRELKCKEINRRYVKYSIKFSMRTADNITTIWDMYIL